MSNQPKLISGAYARIIDEELTELLKNSPELAVTLRKLDDEEEPQQYSQLLCNLLEVALRRFQSEERMELVNRLLELLGAREGQEYILRRKILGSRELLTSIHVRNPVAIPWPLPSTALNTSYLFTGAPGAPSLDHELRQEMRSADRVDFLVSFIKRSGLRLIMPALEEITARGVSIRVITTSYMGASDPEAIAWLVRCPHVQLKVSYDTEHTRLHAKAYHFYRRNGYSTAYIGSANLSGAAITSGLEWTVKITERDQSSVLNQFRGEFEAYWESDNFEVCREEHLDRFRKAIRQAQARQERPEARFFAEITPRPFQERILEKLQTERVVHSSFKNLIVAATGTGKTVISALDYQRYCGIRNPKPRLLFIAHRVEILEQARDCFRAVLRDFNFGDILGGPHEPFAMDYLFSTIASANSRAIIQDLPVTYYDFIIIDEAHHGAALSYRPIYRHFTPRIWLGLTATPERMDGKSILPEFNDRIAAEIRLPEALEERLLCPFHYFGVTDPVSLQEEGFWRNGKYSIDALTAVYTGDDIRARQRIDVLFKALEKYEPVNEHTRAIGFCASVKHAEFMKQVFISRGVTADVLLGETHENERPEIVQNFRSGNLQFVFTVDVLNEGFDLPEINLVMFLRPTDSLTVFLQQLGRGLRHAPGKDCLTVIDLVGQQNRKYRIDRKFAALLPRQRMRIDDEVEAEFPHLPPGCNIYLERVAREQVVRHIRQSLRNIEIMTAESLVTYAENLRRSPSFGEFIDYSGMNPLQLLQKRTWSSWKALARLNAPPADPDQQLLNGSMLRLVQRDGPTLLDDVRNLTRISMNETTANYAAESPERGYMLHYLLYNRKEPRITGPDAMVEVLRRNPTMNKDLFEICEWRCNGTDIPTNSLLATRVGCPLDLHASYSSNEIKAAFGLANYKTAGPTGTGVIHLEARNIYLHFVTFVKSDKDFSPTNRYHDYLLSRKRLHWESQSQTSRDSRTGQNYIHFKTRGYTILFFARINKMIEGETCPFVYLGPASELVSYESDRPIKMVWEMADPVPAEFYEAARLGG